MLRMTGSIALAAGLCFLPIVAGARNIPLAAGTLIRCTVDEPDFSPKTVRLDDPLVCYAQPLREFECSAFPGGTQLAGRLVAYRKPGRFVGKGWMQLEFSRLILPAGETEVKVRVVGLKGFKVDPNGRILGHGHPLRDAAGWVIPFLWPVKVVMLPMRGPEPALKGEQELTLRLLDDVTMPCEGYEGTVWEPYRSSLITPFSQSDSLPNAPTLQQGFRPWKATIIVDNPGALTDAQRVIETTTDSIILPRSGPWPDDEATPTAAQWAQPSVRGAVHVAVQDRAFRGAVLRDGQTENNTTPSSCRKGEAAPADSSALPGNGWHSFEK